MPVPISNVTRRVVYAASGTGPYNFTFEILAAGDIAVYKDDTLLTLTTNYTVTINANGTGFVTLTAAPTGATQIAIVGNRTISRTTDFVTGGDFFANTLNDELDQQTIFNQQNAEGLQRALQAPATDPTSINMTLPRVSLRANKALGFDSSGNPIASDTLGTNRGNWAASTVYYVRDIVKDTSNSNVWQCLTQHTSSGSQPISTNADAAKWFLLVDAAAAATSATNASNSATAAASSAAAASTSASNAATSATNAANSATSASNSVTSAQTAQAAAEAALDSFDDRYLGSKTSDPAVDNDGNALITGALYFNSSTAQMRVYDGASWLTTYTPSPGTGDVNGPASSVDNEIALFSGTGGKTIKRATTTGLLKASSGVIAAAVAGTDYVTPTGTETLTNKTVEAGTFTNGYTEETVSANTSTAYTIDLANGTVQILTLTGSCTFTFPTATSGRGFTLLLKQDGTGSRTVTWPAVVKWPSSTAPTITATANKMDKYVFVADGTNWIGSNAGQNYL